MSTDQPRRLRARGRAGGGLGPQRGDLAAFDNTPCDPTGVSVRVAVSCEDTTVTLTNRHFNTAPLLSIAYRRFFFRDGRTEDLGHAFTEPWIEDNQQLGKTWAGAATHLATLLRVPLGEYSFGTAVRLADGRIVAVGYGQPLRASPTSSCASCPTAPRTPRSEATGSSRRTSLARWTA